MLASGDDIYSKQLRDDLMTLLIAGHETTAAVLTWTMHLLVQHPQYMKRVQDEVGQRSMCVMGSYVTLECHLCLWAWSLL